MELGEKRNDANFIKISVKAGVAIIFDFIVYVNDACFLSRISPCTTPLAFLFLNVSIFEDILIAASQ